MCLSSTDDDEADIIGKLIDELYGKDIVLIQNCLNGSDAVKDISPQFVENVYNVLDKYQNNIFVANMLRDIVNE